MEVIESLDEFGKNLSMAIEGRIGLFLKIVFDIEDHFKNFEQSAKELGLDRNIKEATQEIISSPGFLSMILTLTYSLKDSMASNKKKKKYDINEVYRKYHHDNIPVIKRRKHLNSFGQKSFQNNKSYYNIDSEMNYLQMLVLEMIFKELVRVATTLSLKYMRRKQKHNFLLSNPIYKNKLEAEFIEKVEKEKRELRENSNHMSKGSTSILANRSHVRSKSLYPEPPKKVTEILTKTFLIRNLKMIRTKGMIKRELDIKAMLKALGIKEKNIFFDLDVEDGLKQIDELIQQLSESQQKNLKDMFSDLGVGKSSLQGNDRRKSIVLDRYKINFQIENCKLPELPKPTSRTNTTKTFESENDSETSKKGKTTKELYYKELANSTGYKMYHFENLSNLDKISTIAKYNKI